ncbi:MAG TPA: glycosyltransferase family 4 protein [Anaerolineales bacterium]|nr:glycosyltransferase family 4 protein [Anaerolineales bacterium]
MRVLFVNSREDNQTNPGGDSIQLDKTRAALERLGVAIDVRCAGELNDLPHYDIAHVFNIQTPESALAVFEKLHNDGTPVVFSPIYWDMFEYWFELALPQRKTWRNLARLVGKQRARQVYVSWQKRKGSRIASWRIQRQLLVLADRVLPNSQTEAELLEKNFGLEARFQGKVTVVPNGIDPALYEQPPSPDLEFKQIHGYDKFVLQVGMIYPVKNQLGLIEALYDLPIPLIFVGQVMQAFSDYALQCKERAAERGNVVFIDRIPHEQLPGIYALADVHALPSWRETPGLVSLEAAAAGCRVVTTSIGSTRDYFGDQAWYCYPDNLASIRKAVVSAFEAPPTNELRECVLANFTWHNAAEATLEAYQKVLDFHQVGAH